MQSRENLINTLRQKLKEREYTQKYIAMKLQCNQSAVSHWITGRRRISYDNYIKLIALMEDEKNEAINIDAEDEN